MKVETHSSSSVDLRSVTQQDADDVSLVGARGQVQRSLSSHSGYVRARIVLQQVDNDVHAAHEARHVQRRQSRL